MNILHIISRFDSYDAIAGLSDWNKYFPNDDNNLFVATTLDERILNPRAHKVKYIELPLFETNLIGFFSAYRKLKEIIRINNIDMVHAHSPLPIWLAFFACRNTNRQLVSSCYSPYQPNILSYPFRLAKKIIVHNQAIGKHLIDNFKISKTQIQFLEQGIDLESFPLYNSEERSKTELNIGIISPLVTNKGHEYFLKAMVKVVRNIPYIKIWLISPLSSAKHDHGEDLRLWVRRLGLSNYVNFVESYKIDYDVLSRLHILISPSFVEDVSTRLILEAQACGVPIIATRIAQMTEIISDSSTGILVDPNDHNALANAVINLSKNYKQARDMATSARMEIEKDYNLDTNIKDMFNAYAQVKNTNRILVINIGNVNDIMASIPVLRILREKFPKARIICLIPSEFRSVMARCPYVDELIMYSKPHKFKTVSNLIDIIKLLISKQCDIAFDFTSSFKTCLMSYFSMANKRIGYKSRLLKFMINYAAERQIKADIKEEKFALLKAFGIETKDYELEIWPAEEDVKFVENFLKDNWIGKTKVVCIDISSIDNFLKDWKYLDYITYLCDGLSSQDIRVILVASKHHTHTREELFRRVISKPVLAMGDMSLMRLAYLIKQSNAYLTNDPSSISLAMAVKTPAILLSLGKNKFNGAFYKDLEILESCDFPIDIKTKFSKKKIMVNSAQDKAVFKVKRLIGTE